MHYFLTHTEYFGALAIFGTYSWVEINDAIANVRALNQMIAGARLQMLKVLPSLRTCRTMNSSKIM